MVLGEYKLDANWVNLGRWVPVFSFDYKGRNEKLNTVIAWTAKSSLIMPVFASMSCTRAWQGCIWNAWGFFYQTVKWVKTRSDVCSFHGWSSLASCIIRKEWANWAWVGYKMNLKLKHRVGCWHWESLLLASKCGILLKMTPELNKVGFVTTGLQSWSAVERWNLSFQVVDDWSSYLKTNKKLSQQQLQDSPMKNCLLKVKIIFRVSWSLLKFFAEYPSKGYEQRSESGIYILEVQVVFFLAAFRGW